VTLIRGVDLYRAMGSPAVAPIRRIGIRECLYPVPHMDAFILLRNKPGARKVRRLLRRQQQREGWVVTPKVKRRER
jgi:hypothetical protein